MPSCVLRGLSSRLKLSQHCLRTCTSSFTGPKRGGPCFLLVPQLEATLIGDDSCGWLRDWDRSIKCTDDASASSSEANLHTASVKDTLHHDCAAAESPDEQASRSTHADHARNQELSVDIDGRHPHQDPRAKQSSAVCLSLPSSVLSLSLIHI